MVCLKNICINTLHKGAKDDDDDDDYDNNNNNYKSLKASVVRFDDRVTSPREQHASIEMWKQALK
jgi:hypothetical protein